MGRWLFLWKTSQMHHHYEHNWAHKMGKILSKPETTYYPPAMNSWEQFQSLQGKSYLKVNQTVTGEESLCGRVPICPPVCHFLRSGIPTSSLTALELTRSRLLEAPCGVYLWVHILFVRGRTGSRGITRVTQCTILLPCCAAGVTFGSGRNKQFSIYKIRKFIFANVLWGYKMHSTCFPDQN